MAEKGPFCDVHASGLKGNIANKLGGYHRCYLEDPIHVEFVSDNLCSMLGYKKSELDDLIEGCYTAVMHPDDAASFDAFVYRLAEADGCESVIYRLVKRDGCMVRVADTMTSITDDEGVTRGYSVVCQIPEDESPSHSTVRKERMAVVKVSGDLYASIEQMNDAAAEQVIFSGINRDELRFMDFVAVGDRGIVRKAVERAYAAAYSGKETIAFVSADGEAFRCSLWVDCIRPGKLLRTAVFASSWKSSRPISRAARRSYLLASSCSLILQKTCSKLIGRKTP